MANKPLQSIKFPDLPDTYTVPVVDNTLAVSGAAADAKQTGDSLADKVDKVSGKGLSTEDYTTEENTKLADVETGANKTIIDNTLTQTGQAADAKTVGDAIASEDKKALAAFATDIATGSIASFPDGADNIPMKNVVVHIEPVQAGSGDPSPDNVRPITGWTGAKVTRTGKNLLNPTLASGTYTRNGITWTLNNDGSVAASGTATASSYLWLYGSSSNPGPSWMYKLAGKTVTASSGNGHFIQSGYASIQVILYGSPTLVIREETATIPSDLSPYTGFAIVLFVNTNNTVDATVYPQLELGSTATDYEPYSGQTYDITFPTEVGTVYGGLLDVTSGVLTVTDAQIASYAGETLPGEWISDRDVYVAGTTPTTGAQVVYKLATPVTYHLTPQEITSLLGTNNLWADTGDSEVEYRANTELWVQRKITEAVAAALNS